MACTEKKGNIIMLSYPTSHVFSGKTNESVTLMSFIRYRFHVWADRVSVCMCVCHGETNDLLAHCGRALKENPRFENNNLLGFFIVKRRDDDGGIICQPMCKDDLLR